MKKILHASFRFCILSLLSKLIETPSYDLSKHNGFINETRVFKAKTVILKMNIKIGLKINVFSHIFGLFMFSLIFMNMQMRYAYLIDLILIVETIILLFRRFDVFDQFK